MDLSYNGILAEAREKTQKACEYLVEELKGLRTGRASSALVDHVKVEAYGSPMPLNQVAQIAVPDPKTISIKPFDASLLSAIEKALLKSDLGITPASDGKVVRLIIPMLTEERRNKLAARVKDLAEAQKVAIRNVRRDLNRRADQAEEEGQLTEDQKKKLLQALQDAVKDAEKKIDEIVARKNAEILSV